MTFGSIARLFMSAVYAGVGCGFLFTDMVRDKVPENRLIIGGLLLGYGVLRFYMWQRWNKAQRREEA